jgi:hypothetical protein
MRTITHQIVIEGKWLYLNRSLVANWLLYPTLVEAVMIKTIVRQGKLKIICPYRKLEHLYKKPNVFDEIQETFGRPKNSEVCVVGDMLLVDITMGRRFNYFTILVEPINIRNENLVVRLMRKIESLV